MHSVFSRLAFKIIEVAVAGWFRNACGIIGVEAQDAIPAATVLCCP